jgi:hypothetical protein
MREVYGQIYPRKADKTEDYCISRPTNVIQNWSLGQSSTFLWAKHLSKFTKRMLWPWHEPTEIRVPFRKSWKIAAFSVDVIHQFCYRQKSRVSNSRAFRLALSISVFGSTTRPLLWPTLVCNQYSGRARRRAIEIEKLNRKA